MTTLPSEVSALPPAGTTAPRPAPAIPIRLVSRLRLPRPARWLWLLALLPAVAHAEVRGDYTARLAELEGVMDSCYRGESLKNEQDRIGRMTESYNREVKHRNAGVADAHAAFESRSAALAELKRQIDAADKSLEQQPAASDRDAIIAYNARVRDRNALVDHYRELAQRLNADMESRKTAEDRLDADLAARQAEVEAAQRRCTERG